MSRSVTLSVETPVASLLEAAGVTKGHLARQLGIARESIRDGESVKLSTLVKYAEALGYTLEPRVIPKPSGK